MSSQESARKAKPILVWAIDPLEGETRPSLANFRAMSQWAQMMDWEIQPTTVFTPNVKDLERGLLGSVNHVQSALDSYLKKYKNVNKGRVLVNEYTSQSAAVSKLLRFARQVGASAIAVSSHGRSGFDRIMLGSFAEKVLQNSPWPVFFINHHQPAKKKSNNAVVFPTNFSDESWVTYREFLKSASKRDLELILLHIITFPLELNVGMAAYLPDDLIQEQVKWATREGARWEEEGKKWGVKVKCLLRTGGVGALSGEAILDTAQELSASTIVMHTQSVALGRLFLGSVAYPVFRANRFLSILYGPKARALQSLESDSETLAEMNL